MEVYKYIKNIYIGANNIFTHITLFSIFGIFSLIFSKLYAHFLNSTFLGYGPKTGTELLICLISGILTLIYMWGYLYNYSNKLLNTQTTDLPDVTLSSFHTFIKMLPAIIIWTTYFIILFIIGLSIFNIKLNPIKYSLYMSLIICMMPFTGIIWGLYSKEYKNIYNLYNPLQIFVIINKTFFKIFKLLFEIIILVCIFSVIPIYIIKTSIFLTNPTHQLFCRIISLTILIYIINIAHYVYIQGIVEIIRNKILKKN